MVAKLAKRFGETLRSVGLQRAEGLVEVYASEKTGTWTILVTRPDGMSCLLAAGELWEEEPKAVRRRGRLIQRQRRPRRSFAPVTASRT